MILTLYQRQVKVMIKKGIMVSCIYFTRNKFLSWMMADFYYFELYKKLFVV